MATSRAGVATASRRPQVPLDRRGHQGDVQICVRDRADGDPEHCATQYGKA
ncbi:hypothetical protein [Streptomyces sp. SID8499]|uniref:hypothetical protein n=1 Tax=Streptomyces sp. SID8499 TaxID=2706106 RepID=UPI0013CB6378|nr:hypothetical protein [Streptomyces sp. SID8499]NED37114.1 hypothetical protein [Streptomyces sp. SID8499]